MDAVEVTWTSVQDLRKDMEYFDPATMCMRITLPGKGLPAGWRLRMTKKHLGETLCQVYKTWPTEGVSLTFEAPPEMDELQGLSPRSADGVRLVNAAYAGDMDAVQSLLAGRAPPDIQVQVKGCNSALNMAARGGHLDIMKLLLERQVDPNSRNHFHETPLLCGANRARGSACRLLLQAMADPHAVDENGDNALDFLGPGDSERKRHCREILQQAGCLRR